MRRCLLFIALVAANGCGRAPSPQGAIPEAPAARRADMDEFFVTWLKNHGHADVVVDAGGVGVGDNPTRLQAGLYESKRHEKGGYVVEVQFTIRLPTGGTIAEFVAGLGESEERAINDALLNFTLTTFHVVYKGFINADDPHLMKTTVAFAGVDRDLIAGDILLRGPAANGEIDLAGLRTEIQEALRTFPLAPGPHWIKVVYSQTAGKPTTVAVTLDNLDHPRMTEAVRRLKWPTQDGFYMAKQFLVIP